MFLRAKKSELPGAAEALPGWVVSDAGLALLVVILAAGYVVRRGQRTDA